MPKKNPKIENTPELHKKTRGEGDEISIDSIIEHQIDEVKPPTGKIKAIKYNFECSNCGKKSNIEKINKETKKNIDIIVIKCPECEKMTEFI